MTAMTSAFPPVIIPSREVLLREFHSDLAALATKGELPSRDAVLTQPHLLRTLAAAAATQVPRGVDRLVGERDDAALVTAVALYSGLRFCLVDVTTKPMSVTGPLHPGEAVVIIGYDPSVGRRGLQDQLVAADVAVLATVVVPTDVLSPPGSNAAASNWDASSTDKE